MIAGVMIRPIAALTALLFCASPAFPQTEVEKTPAVEKPAEPTPAPSKFRGDDGWLDVSGFLDEKYGFLPIVIPITEPAVGYGAAGALAFLSKPLGQARDGFFAGTGAVWNDFEQ